MTNIQQEIESLLEHYTDVCAMCTKFDKCEVCDIADFIEELRKLTVDNKNNSMKYYKVVCIDAISDKWQVLVYDENRRIIDCEFCTSSDMWLGYCRGLNLCGCKEL